MQKTLAGLIVLAGIALAAASTGTAQSPAPAPAPTFAKEVAPILYANCVGCHRAGEIGPMSLTTYAEARPWARAIGRVVAEGVMPPWHAAEAGRFENERTLTAAQKDTIAKWVAAGAPEGNPADAPAPPSLTDGWRIGTPDTVLEMPEAYRVPARGKIEYEYFYLPTNFSEAKWLQAIEVRPGNRAVVHHVLVYYLAPAEPGVALAPIRPVAEHSRTPPRRDERGIATNPPRRIPGQQRRLLATYAPGTDPQVFRPGTAIRLAPGGTLELQMHYTTSGTAADDRTRVGMIFAKERPAHELRAAQFINAAFTIPAGAQDHRVDTEVTFTADATVWGLFPHTHVRGKRWEYVLVTPDGSRETILSVPRYDFNWQTYYMFKEPLQVTAGSRILSSAWYDNSARNRANPDPTVAVGWGDQTWEEMQYTGLIVSARSQTSEVRSQ